jgi:aerobic-type carbon monoxide dehydrogenase small subunit (CoxS/CutS family)
MSILHTISLNVNGKEYSLEIEPNRTLLEVLREDLSLPGTKPNCLEGECGCCTVLLDDLAINSCLFLAVRANGKKIQTIEGLSNGADLHPVQLAFIEHGAIQCGYCTPGFVMSTIALLKENKNPGTEEIERALAGNICRCTGYSNIRDAINAVIEEGETGSE